MKHSLRVGFSFGLTSGIITTLGLMVGLNSSTNSRLVVVGGVLTIAIADAFSDAMGIHVSQESENRHTVKEVWESTFFTFLCKFVFSAIFIVPVLILELKAAIIISVIIGLYLLFLISLDLARKQNIKPWKVIGEHLTIAIVVIVLTHYIGYWISLIFR